MNDEPRSLEDYVDQVKLALLTRATMTITPELAEERARNIVAALTIELEHWLATVQR